VLWTQKIVGGVIRAAVFQLAIPASPFCQTQEPGSVGMGYSYAGAFDGADGQILCELGRGEKQWWAGKKDEDCGVAPNDGGSECAVINFSCALNRPLLAGQGIETWAGANYRCRWRHKHGREPLTLASADVLPTWLAGVLT
jgi:hypothetical protein